MATMSKSDLTTHIKDVVVPLIKDTVGKDIAELVRENVEASLKNSQQPGRDHFSKHLYDEEPPEQEANVGAYVRCLAAARNDKERAVKIARAWGYRKVADALEVSREKAMSAGDPIGGGFLVPTEFSREVIELLRASGVVRSLNPTTIPMPTGVLKVPRITAGSSATYIGENTNITKSELQTGQLDLTFKKLAALVPISNDLIRHAAPSADTVVRDDMIREVAKREDLGFLRDNGVNGKPKGIKNWIHSDNKFNANGTVSLANVTNDLGKAMQLLMDANITLTMQQGATAVDVRPGWVFSPRTWRYLVTVQTSLGTHAFRDEMLRGTLWGYPFRVTSQIPIVMSGGADTGGNQTEVYFGAFAHAVIGEALAISVDASQEAAYHDGSNVIASFSQDQTVVRVLTEHDFALRHDKSFVLIEQVTWGV